MVYLTGYGFPRWRGGPMQYAAEVGLQNVVERMHALRDAAIDEARREAWIPAPLLVERAALGAGWS